MNKTLIRTLILTLVIALVCSLAVGCGGDTSSANSQNANNNSSSDSGVDGMLPEVNPEDYRGTKVVLATRTDPFKNEDGPVCTKFMEEYGIDFEFRLISGGEYVNTIAAAIAADQQPDVFYENDSFPGSLTVMQPLDNAKLDLTAPIWNQSIIKGIHT